MFWCCLFILNTVLLKYNKSIQQYLKAIIQNDKKLTELNGKVQPDGYKGCYSENEIQNILKNINCCELLINFEQYAKNIINVAFMYYSVYTKRVVKPIPQGILNRRFNRYLSDKYKNIFSAQNSRKYKIHIKSDKRTEYEQLNQQFAELYTKQYDLNFNDRQEVWGFINKLLNNIIDLQYCIQGIYKNNMYEQDNYNYITEYDLYNRYLKTQQIIKSPLGQYTNLDIATIVPTDAINYERRKLLLQKHQCKYDALCNQQHLSKTELEALNPYLNQYSDDCAPRPVTEQEYLQQKRQTFLKKIQYQQRFLNTR